MKILIIGKNSYIGNNLDNWLTNHGYQVSQLDVLNENWREYDYSPFDIIIHVAGIVHRPDCHDWNLYRSVNTDMPIEIALRAKSQGVKTYVFFSTMGVYGIDKELKPNIVDQSTGSNATSMYGKSKFMAEQGLFKLKDDNFSIVIVRPPSVYGKGCKGGYISGFIKITKLLPIIPNAYSNVRQSFIYIDNLCECVRIIIDNQLSGIFCPQDDEIPNANDLLRAITLAIGRTYRSSKILGWLTQLLPFIPLVRKAFGGIEYSRKLSDIKGQDYVVVPFKEAIKRTVS